MKTRRTYTLPDYEDFIELKFTRRELKRFFHRHQRSLGDRLDYLYGDKECDVLAKNVSRKPMRDPIGTDGAELLELPDDLPLD